MSTWRLSPQLSCLLVLALTLPVALAGGPRPIPDEPAKRVPAQAEDDDWTRDVDDEDEWDEEGSADDPWLADGEQAAEDQADRRQTGRLERRSNVEDTIRGTIRTVPVRIERLSKEGIKLATKGATYTANARLIEILEIIADNLDAEEGTTEHSRALAAGLTALRESEDFSKASAFRSERAAISNRALGHTTPVVRRSKAEGITRLEALELYHSYASRQLAKAVAGVPEGATTLCQLGRLQPFLRDSRDQQTTVVTTRMVALQESALLVDPRNYQAANELGVVLAKSGQLEAAKDTLIYSAYIGKRPETLRNLSIVLQKLGDDQAAGTMLTLAEKQRDEIKSQQSSETNPENQSLIYWVDHKEFAARGASAEADAPMELNGQKAAEPKPETEPKKIERGKPSSPRFFKRFMSSARRELINPKLLEKIDSQNEAESGNEEALADSQATDDGVQQTGWVRKDRKAPRNESVDMGDQGTMWWDVFNQGEYIGPARTQHVPDYYLRVDDSIGFVFRLNGKPSTETYRLNIGDVIRITSVTATNLLVETMVQPDGTIVLPQVGSVSAVGKTLDGLRMELDTLYRDYYRDPSIIVAPVTINKTVEELRNSIINRSGIFNGQVFAAKVTPDGTVQLPAIGSVPAQGLTLVELRAEVEYRYAEIAGGIEVTPVLQQRAPRNIYVLGEVARPGRFELVAPTTAIQSISLAGGWNKGGNLWNVVVFRRDENWRLMATRVNVRPALYNKKDLQADDIWLRDSDIVIVPKLPIQVVDDYVEMIFTKAIYGVVPLNVTLGYFNNLTTIGGAITP